MSSDRKEPGANNNANSTWIPPEQQGSKIDERSIQPQQQIDNTQQPHALDQIEDDGDDENMSASRVAAPIDIFKHLGQYALLIIVPLIFGALAALLILPPIAAGQAVFPPESFWPTFLIIIAIVIGQGTAVYFSGSYNGMWIIGTAGGFCLFLLLGFFALFGPIPGIMLFIALIILGVLIIRRFLHPVPEGSVDIIHAMKRYNRTLYPGFNILLPWEEVYTQLNIEEIQWMCPPQVIQLSRDEDVILQAVISYQLIPEDAHLAIRRGANWEENLRTLFQTTLQTVAATFTPNDFLTWPDGRHAHMDDDSFTGSFERREQLNAILFNLMRDKVALWGIQINWASLRDIYLVPHGTAVINRNRESAATAQPTKVQQPINQAQPAAMGAIPMEKTPVAPPSKQPIEANTADRVVAPKQVGTTPKSATVLSKEEQTTIYEQKPTVTALPVERLNEELLIKAYRSVQDGQITDPATIRDIAASFEAVAKSPAANQAVSFDPARAALNLYDQARKYEEQHYQ